MVLPHCLKKEKPKFSMCVDTRSPSRANLLRKHKLSSACGNGKALAVNSCHVCIREGWPLSSQNIIHQSQSLPFEDEPHGKSSTQRQNRGNSPTELSH